MWYRTIVCENVDELPEGEFPDFVNKYIQPAEASIKFPNLPAPSYGGSIPVDTVMLTASDENSLDEFIVKNRKMGLSHLVIDDSGSEISFLKDVFYNENKFPYLSKVYDSSEKGFSMRVKIYRINYDDFQENLKINTNP